VRRRGSPFDSPHWPHTIAEAVAQLRLAERRRHRDWGSEKLLQCRDPAQWTQGDLLIMIANGMLDCSQSGGLA